MISSAKMGQRVIRPPGEIDARRTYTLGPRHTAVPSQPPGVPPNNTPQRDAPVLLGGATGPTGNAKALRARCGGGEQFPPQRTRKLIEAGGYSA